MAEPREALGAARLSRRATDERRRALRHRGGTLHPGFVVPEDRRSGELGDRPGEDPGRRLHGPFRRSRRPGRGRHAAGYRHADASVKVTKLSPNAKVPVKATDGAAGYDLFASEATVIPASAVREGRVEIGHGLVATGIAISLPPGHVGRIGSRSGLSTRHNIEVRARWIDPDYPRGIKTELKNFANRNLGVVAGER